MRNIIATLQTLFLECELTSLCNTIELRRFEEPYADLRLFLGDQPAVNSAPAARLVSALGQLPEVTSVKPKKSVISVRLCDDFIQTAGRALELGESPAEGIDAGFGSKLYLIGFLGPNTSKALHLGHLRNIIVGNALASAFTCAGAVSESYSLVGDIGRNICEAMAGYQMFNEGEALPPAGMKPDHFVGRCYKDYLMHARDSLENPGDGTDPCAREHVPATDLADDLLQRWRDGDNATRSLWLMFREMVETGHNKTLASLGVVVKRCYYESDHVDHASDLITRGLSEGLLERLDDGMVVYNTGRDEFRKIVLQRSDGFPTEHGRVLAVFHHIFHERPEGCVHIDWNGTEWEPAQTVLKDLMQALYLIPGNSVHTPVFHGMLLFDGEKMSSSHQNEPVLVDELLERLWHAPEVSALAEAYRGCVDPRVIADIIVKGFFLFEPVSKPLAYSWSRLIDPAVNRGWSIAHAWCRVNSSVPGGDELNSGSHPAYRLAVMQAQSFPQILTNATRKIQPESLTRFLIHFCDRYLTSAPSPPLNRVALTVLRAALKSLGFSTCIDQDSLPYSDVRAAGQLCRLIAPNIGGAP
jgi:arginyl-tRNA synthetase